MKVNKALECLEDFFTIDNGNEMGHWERTIYEDMFQSNVTKDQLKELFIAMRTVRLYINDLEKQ